MIVTSFRPMVCFTDAAWLIWGKRTGTGVTAAAGPGWTTRVGGGGFWAMALAERKRAASVPAPIREENLVMVTPFVGDKDTRPDVPRGSGIEIESRLHPPQTMDNVSSDTGPQSLVRPATETDAEEIFRVHSDSIRVLCNARYGPEEIAAWIAVRSPDSYRVALASRALYVAERQGEILGFGQLDPEKAEIEACYVAPGAVRCGIGGALLSRMESEARRRGHSVVRLNSTLNAEEFYARCGYRWLGKATHRVAGKVDLACIRMEKTL